MRALFTLVASLMATAAFGEQQLPVYPGTVHTRIGNELVVSGERYRIAYFTTADPLKNVARYFRDQWLRQGYPTTADGDWVDEGVVSAIYTREGLLRSVVLRRHQGVTVGFSVLKDLWVRSPALPQPGIVALEGTLFSHDLSSGEHPGAPVQRTMLIGRELAAVREDLAHRLTAQDFSLVRQTGGQKQGRQSLVLELGRGEEQVVTALTEVDPGLTAVSQTWIRTVRADSRPVGGAK